MPDSLKNLLTNLLAKFKDNMKKSTSMILLVIGGLVLVGVLTWILSLFLPGPDTEIEIGIIIVIAVAALMLLLFIMAAGFTILNLSDGKQALGLPEGSIRAMIALILVLVFIICGTYLFRLVGTGYATTYPNQTPEEMQKIQGKIIRKTTSPKNAENFDVIVQSDLTPDAVKLAQQLVTTIGNPGCGGSWVLLRKYDRQQRGHRGPEPASV